MTTRKERTVRVKLSVDGTLRRRGSMGAAGGVIRSKVDYAKLDSAAAFAPDADTPKLTVRELQGMRRPRGEVVSDSAAIRARLRMSQAAFAALFGLSVRTIQEWEQGRRRPDGPARALLRVIEREPAAVRRALAS